MNYTWNARKNRRNAKLHAIAFEDAIRIFDGPTVEKEDDRFDYDERRVYAIGVVNGLEITLIYSERGEDERLIISAWRSEPHERRHYLEASGGIEVKANGVKTKSRSKASPSTDWNRLRKMSASTIRRGIAADPDTHSTDAQFWKTAKVVLPTPKQIVTMRLDADLLRWFRRQPGYQTRINAILRAYMQAQEST